MHSHDETDAGARAFGGHVAGHDNDRDRMETAPNSRCDLSAPTSHVELMTNVPPTGNGLPGLVRPTIG
jgi:hypothetical protein